MNEKLNDSRFKRDKFRGVTAREEFDTPRSVAMSALRTCASQAAGAN